MEQEEEKNTSHKKHHHHHHHRHHNSKKKYLENNNQKQKNSKDYSKNHVIKNKEIYLNLYSFLKEKEKFIIQNDYDKEHSEKILNEKDLALKRISLNSITTNQSDKNNNYDLSDNIPLVYNEDNINISALVDFYNRNVFNNTTNKKKDKNKNKENNKNLDYSGLKSQSTSQETYNI